MEVRDVVLLLQQNSLQDTRRTNGWPIEFPNSYLPMYPTRRAMAMQLAWFVIISSHRALCLHYCIVGSFANRLNRGNRHNLQSCVRHPKQENHHALRIFKGPLGLARRGSRRQEKPRRSGEVEGVGRNWKAN